MDVCWWCKRVLIETDEPPYLVAYPAAEPAVCSVAGDGSHESTSDILAMAARYRETACRKDGYPPPVR